MRRVLCSKSSRNSRKYESSPVNAGKAKRLIGIGGLVGFIGGDQIKVVNDIV
jgi:hypothetical protein